MNFLELSMAGLVIFAIWLMLYRRHYPRPGTNWSKWATQRSLIRGPRKLGLTRYLEGTFEGRQVIVQHALPLVGRGHPCEIQCTASVPDFRVSVERRQEPHPETSPAADEPPVFVWVYTAVEDLHRSAGMERLNAMVKTTDVQAHFRALNPDYFGIVDAMLTASWETSPDGIHSMDERLDAAMALAAALEQADGAAWQTFADHHDFVFTQGPSGWLLVREDDHCTHRIHHHPGQRSSTQFETSPRLASAWPEGLWIQPTCDDAPNTRTGNPILDQFVSIQCLDPEAARRMGSAELTPAILALVSGHGGHVVDGQIHVYRSDLVVDPTEILTDITTLALALCAATESG